MIKKKIIKTYVDGYLDIWRSLFYVKKTTTKSDFTRFVWFNFLCILIVAVKISNLIKDDGLIYTISFLFFLGTFFFALLKVDIPNLLIMTLFKIIFIGILVAIANCYTLFIEDSYHLGLAGLVLIGIYFFINAIFVIIAILFFNTLRRTPITNLSLIVYFIILLIVTNRLMKLSLEAII
jgi:hypothetical protein